MKKLLSKICRSRKAIDPGRLNKILFIKLFAIGDCLNSTPALRALRKALPDAQIDVMVGDWSEAVFRNNPRLNNLIVVDDYWFRESDISSLLKLMRRLRRERYDAMLLFHRSPRLGAFFRLCKPRALIGLNIDGDGYWLTHPVTEDGVTHETEVYNSLLKPLQVDADGCNMEIFPTGEESEEAGSLWHAAGFEAGDSIIGLTPGGAQNPGETMPQRIWPFYGMLAVKLIKLGFNVAYFGGPGDQDALEDLPSGDACASFIGKTDLAVSAELMKRCRLVVTHDSGPMHLAAAAGARTLSIFAPTDPRRKAPLGNGHSFLTARKECAPCYYRGHWPEQCNRECIDTITPDQVLKTIHEMLLS
jgi:heptosyltransferase-2